MLLNKIFNKMPLLFCHKKEKPMTILKELSKVITEYLSRRSEKMDIDFRFYEKTVGHYDTATWLVSNDDSTKENTIVIRAVWYIGINHVCILVTEGEDIVMDFVASDVEDLIEGEGNMIATIDDRICYDESMEKEFNAFDEEDFECCREDDDYFYDDDEDEDDWDEDDDDCYDDDDEYWDEDDDEEDMED